MNTAKKGAAAERRTMQVLGWNLERARDFDGRRLCIAWKGRSELRMWVFWGWRIYARWSKFGPFVFGVGPLRGMYFPGAEHGR